MAMKVEPQFRMDENGNLQLVEMSLVPCADNDPHQLHVIERKGFPSKPPLKKDEE